VGGAGERGGLHARRRDRKPRREVFGDAAVSRRPSTPRAVEGLKAPQDQPSPIRTLPSAPEFHRIVRRSARGLYRRSGIGPCGPHPAPKACVTDNIIPVAAGMSHPRKPDDRHNSFLLQPNLGMPSFGERGRLAEPATAGPGSTGYIPSTLGRGDGARLYPAARNAVTIRVRCVGPCDSV